MAETPEQRQKHGAASGLRGALSLRGARQWLDFEGCRVAWTERVLGSRRPVPEQTVVCLHDLNSGSREFAPLVANCQAGYRLVMLDWPGHGASDVWPGGSQSGAVVQAEPLTMAACVRMVAAVADAVVDTVESAVAAGTGSETGASRRTASRRITLAGSGFGAAVALAFAAAHPERVLGLVLSQPAGLLPPARPAGGPNRLFRWLKAGRGHTLTPARRQSLRCALAAEESDTEALFRALGDSREVVRWAAGTVTCPMLIALARESRSYPMRQSLSLLEQRLAGSSQHRLTVFSGGSNPIWDEPKRFAIALASHVQSQLPLEIHHHGWILSGVDWPARGLNLWKCVHTECGAEQFLPAGEDANSVSENG